MHVLSDITVDMDRFPEPSEEFLEAIGEEVLPEIECAMVTLDLTEDVPVIFDEGEIAGHVDGCVCCQRRAVGQAGLN